MNRAEYLQDPDVGDFLNWAEPLVRIERCLPVSEQQPFVTLSDAFEDYKWDFSVTLPGEGKPQGGSSYERTVSVLTALRKQLFESEKRGDADEFRQAAAAVLHWGRVGGHNEKYLDRLGDEALPRLTSNARLLDPATAELGRLSVVAPMNSGYSKIYSLLVDGLPIYDSRVACALASLVRMFCHEEGREAVPEALRVDVPLDRATVCRDPSCEQFRFERIAAGSTTRYARSNVKAAWLLGKLAKHPPFSQESDPLHALQSALFMIGYAPLDRPCSHCTGDA